MPRLIIVSNRLPVTVRRTNEGVTVERSSGGLATGMTGPHESRKGLWIGWPGDMTDLSNAEQQEVDRQLAEHRLVPIALSVDEVNRYYENYSNAVLWPLFHYFTSRLPLIVDDFGVYERVNARFADAVATQYQPGDLIWVHDYQLLLVPAMLRARIPEARIGFFLHIPFPSSEVFRLLPNRELLIEGLLGADLVGFHTAGYLRHFASAVHRITSAPTAVDRIRWKHGDVHLGVFPMGIDAEQFSVTASSSEVHNLVAEHTREGIRLLVGVDRLDYTKGIPRRLLAFETMLQRHPELHGKIRLVQVAVPSREKVEAYREFRDGVDAIVGRIHGEFATPAWSPIHYLYRHLSPVALLALYRAADVMLVTPLRDGMNLVAKEFVASRSDGDGVLVLSEFAGAATELSEALRLNPYDIDGTAETFHRALSMPEEERRMRMAVLRDRVMQHDVHRWARAFLARLEATESAGVTPKPSSPGAIRVAIEKLRTAPRLLLFLDFDGTLVPFAPSPELAVPDKALLVLLRRLATRPNTEVHLVSGRKRATMDRWFGALPLGLHAEHGFWSRLVGGTWASAVMPDLRWREPALEILRDFTERTPGALIEEKSAGYAWHFRAADPEYGAAQARELAVHLSALLTNAPVELLHGDRVVELRPHGIHKGRVVQMVLSQLDAPTLAMAAGDDRTDEDLFAALPEGSVSVHVGPMESSAGLRVADVLSMRALLAQLAN